MSMITNSQRLDSYNRLVIAAMRKMDTSRGISGIYSHAYNRHKRIFIKCMDKLVTFKKENNLK